MKQLSDFFSCCRVGAPKSVVMGWVRADLSFDILHWFEYVAIMQEPGDSMACV